jgi:uncharacterized protein
MKISLVHLSEGLHRLHFEETLAKLGLDKHPNLHRDVRIEVELEKRSPQYFLKNMVRTEGRFCCDRCLKEFDLNVSEESRVMFSTDAEIVKLNDSEEIEYLDSNAKEIDITDVIRDTLLLSIPMKLLCSEDCRGLCAGCGVNLNEEPCRCAEPPIDTRWEALRKLL